MGLAVPLVMGSFPCFFKVYSSSALQGNLGWGKSPLSDHTDKGDMLSLRSSLSTFKIFVLVFSALMCLPCSPGFSLQVKCQQHRQSHRVSFRSVKDITEEDLGNVAITVRDKVYDKVLVTVTFRKCRTDSSWDPVYKQQQAFSSASS